MNEKELIQLLQNGDSDAFKIIVTEHQDQILNTCYRFLRNREDAEDVAQDVFVEAFQSVESFRGDAKISTWLYRIAVTKSLDFIRRGKRKKRFALLKSIWVMEEQGEDLPAASEPDPHMQLEKKERQTILNEALGAIPDNQKIAITLSKYEGLSNKEITEVMDISLSAVESLIHRAKKSLESKLSDYYKKII